jgi:hypothetical protein
MCLDFKEIVKDVNLKMMTNYMNASFRLVGTQLKPYIAYMHYLIASRTFCRTMRVISWLASPRSTLR